MRKLPLLILMLLLVAIVVACSKTPPGIISERKMKNLLKDIYRAEAYMENRTSSFESDSEKMVLKQSIFEKHGVTQAMYDSSLVWYAKNLDVLNNVYQKVGKELQEEAKRYQKKIGASAPQQQQGQNSGRTLKKYHAASGDTADLWTQPRLWMVTQAMNGNYVKFDYAPDKQMRSGDRYQLTLKLLTGSSEVQIVMALQYLDGSISYISRKMSHNGWLDLILQADTARTVKRLCGYLAFKLRNNAPVAFADSIQLLRTHFDDKQYGFISMQKNLNRNFDKQDDSKQDTSKRVTIQPAEPKPAAAKPVATQPAGTPAPVRLPNGHYRPQPGVNKSGVEHQRKQLTPVQSLRHNPKPATKPATIEP